MVAQGHQNVTGRDALTNSDRYVLNDTVHLEN
jgi:hypothetical protein